MCGIAGSVNIQLNRNYLDQALFHRGPDQKGIIQIDNLCLYHYRLSILDIQGGNQPMTIGDLSIVFNGEIYNHKSLRKKYSLSCISNSDTETLLRLFQLKGTDCLHDLDGMFAFAIYDSSDKKLILARDRAGEKPLFYYSFNDRFLFASELNALKSQVDPTINLSALQAYLTTGYFFHDQTPYNSIYKLPAGSYATFDVRTNAFEVRKWWDIGSFYRQGSTDTLQDSIEKVEQKLKESIRDRIDSSDLEVGSFLSGGIDSGLVTAMAAEHKSSLKTFTVSFSGGFYDESSLARKVAERYRTQHHEIKISFDLLSDDIENILCNYGLPFFDSSAIPSYYVSKEAKKYITVILNGDGGDELFGGYRRYVPFSRYDFFGTANVIRIFAKQLGRITPVPKDKNSKYNYLHRLIQLTARSNFDCYTSSTLDIFDGFTSHFNFDSSKVLDIHLDSFDRINKSAISGLKKIQNLDFDHILEADLLMKMDIATMSNSLEGRSPLLGKELLEYMPMLPDSYKINGATTKFLLRKLATKYLPEGLINQPKRGFEIPLKEWVDGQLSTIMADYLLAPNAYVNEFMNANFIKDLWAKKVHVGPEKRAKMMWSLFALEVWYQRLFKSNLELTP